MTQENCFHCGEPAIEGQRWTLDIDGEAKTMCCPACKAVAETIIGAGLKDYYRHRTALPEISPAQKRAASSEVREELKLYDSPAVQKSFVIQSNDKQSATHSAEAMLVIEGISCAACGWLIEHRLSQLEGVNKATLNLSSHRLLIDWQVDDLRLSQILEEIHQLGYQAHPFSATKEEEKRQQEKKTAFRRLAVAGIATMQVMMISVPLYAGEANGIKEQYAFVLRMASLVFATAVVMFSARPFFSAAIRDLQTRHLTMDVPVSLAILLAYFSSVWSTFNDGPEVYFDSVCMFTFFLLTGRFFEMRARHRMNQAGNNLLDLMPNAAIKSTADGDMVIASEDIQQGDVLIIKPGQQIPADGEVLTGSSAVDEAALTGEYLPVTKQPGTALLAGTHNVESQLTMKVTATGADAQLNTIMRLMDRAQQEKPAIAILADRVSSWFVAAVLLTTLSVAGVWYFIAPEQAFWISLSVLVVTCPCALSLATPTALTAATASLREQGFLISKGHVLEGLNQVNRVVFDKTGTLTQGELTLESLILAAPQADKEKLISIAASLEQYSNHPIAKAFSQVKTLPCDDVQQIPAQGVQGQYLGDEYRIGRSDFACPQHTLVPPIEDERQWLLLSKNQQPMLWIALNDSIRAGAKGLIQQLRAHNIKVSVLTGDPSPAARKTCQELGIDDVYTGLSPQQKLEYAKQWQSEGDVLMMVGDGINDVPTLAGAEVAITIGSASDLAQTNADSIVTSGHLASLGAAMMKAKGTRRIIKQNIGWALLYNLIALPMAATGMIPPWAAALGMSFSSLIVVFNALRLLKKEADWHKAQLA